MILQESQCNIIVCLLENPVSCTGISEEHPTTSGTKSTDSNQQSLCLLHKTPLLLSCPLTLALFQTPLAGNKNSQQNMSIPRKDLLLFYESTLQNKLQEDQKRKEDYRSEEIIQNTVAEEETVWS